MTRTAVVPLTFLCLGCGTEPTPPQAADVRVTVVPASGGDRAKETRTLTANVLAGRYGVGDGLGYNLSLELNADGAFDCTWTGCLGTYGTASGSWSPTPAGVSLAARSADGMLVGEFEHPLPVVDLDGHLLLIAPGRRDWFHEYGPDAFGCLHEEDARPALAAAGAHRWARLLEDAGE